MKKGGAKTARRKGEKKTRKRIIMRKSMKRKNTLKRNINALLKNSNKKPIETEFEDYEKIGNIFEKFFQSIIKRENTINIKNEESFDMFKLDVQIKLEEIDTKYGSILNRIKKDLPDVFEELKDYIDIPNNSNMNMNTNTDIIELYYEILHGLRKILDDNDLNSKTLSDTEYIRQLLTENLIDKFIDKNENIEDELLNMFKGITLERNIANIFKNIKL